MFFLMVLVIFFIMLNRLVAHHVVSSAPNRVITIARAELGVLEEGQNSGDRVGQYLDYVHLKKGNAWCAAFVCWTLGKAGLSNPRSGWSPDLFKDHGVCRCLSGRSVQRPVPRAGDVFGLWIASKGRIAHVGFIERWTDHLVTTIEGNSVSATDSRLEGVFRKRRHRRTIYVVRYTLAEGERLSDRLVVQRRGKLRIYSSRIGAYLGLKRDDLMRFPMLKGRRGRHDFPG